MDPLKETPSAASVSIATDQPKTLYILWNASRVLVLMLTLLLLAIVFSSTAVFIFQISSAWFYVSQLLLITSIVIVGALLLTRILHRFLTPLAQISHWAARIRRGDLTVPIPVELHEFSNLAHDINAVGKEFESLTREMNVRIQTQTVRLARKTQSLDILYEVAASLNQSLTLDKLLASFLETLMDLVDARAGSVRLLTSEGQTRIVTSHGLEAQTVEKDRFTDIGLCACGWAIQDGKIQIQKGTRHCDLIIKQQYLQSDCAEFVAVPIQYQHRTLGVYNLFLDKPVSTLGEDAHDLLTSIGRHLGMAIEKARLDNDAHRLAIMEERGILGNELHDSLAQSLVGMRLQIKMLGETLHKKDIRTAQHEVQRLRTAVEDAHLNLRELLASFRLKIDERGLAHAIAGMIERFRSETSIAVFFQNECRSINLTPTQEIQVFFIIQEALTNIRKHSNARNVRVLLNNEDDLYTVLIEDDGLGMTETTETHSNEHIGLTVMHERAQRLSGELVIESEPGEGTRLILIFTAPPITATEHRTQET